MRKSERIIILYRKYETLETILILFIVLSCKNVGPVYKNDIPSKPPDIKLPK
jgi:hypothetical protein